MTCQSRCSLSESSDEKRVHCHPSAGFVSMGDNPFAMANNDATTSNDEKFQVREGIGRNDSEAQRKSRKTEDSIEDGDVIGAAIYFNPTPSQPSAVPNFLQDDQSDASYKIDETLTALFKKLNINKLVERLEKAERHSSAAAKQNEEMAKKLGKMESANDALKIELAQSGRNQAALLDNGNKLLARLDEKERILCDMTKEKIELVERIDVATGLNNRIESEMNEAQAGLAQATAASAAAEISITSLCSAIEELRRENESHHQEVTDRIESEIQEARANLLQATSTAVESTLASIRGGMEELRRENSSLQEQVMSRLDTDLQESRASLLQATSAAAVAESTILPLQSEIKKVRMQNESLQEQLNERQDNKSDEQEEEEDEAPVPKTPSIGFEDVSTITTVVKMPKSIMILFFCLVIFLAKLFQPFSKLLVHLDEKDLSSIMEESTKIAKKVTMMEGLNDHLQSKVKGLEDHRANELNKLLESVGERGIALCNIASAKNKLVEKLAKETGTNTLLKPEGQELRAELLQATSATTAAELKANSDKAAAESTIASLCSEDVELRRENESLNEKLTESQLRVESEIQEVRSGLAQATAASAVTETSMASLCSAIEELRRENESLHQGVTDRIESEIQEARTNLMQATSAAVESTVASIREEMEELRRENSSLQEQVMSRIDTDIEESRASLLQATSAAAVAESIVLSLRSELEELRTQNESLQEQLNQSQDNSSKEQEEDEVTVPPTSSIGFEDVFTTTGSEKVPNGYHGLNWENVRVMHRSAWPGSGYERGIVSGDYVAFNSGVKPCSISSTTPFSVAGFQATAAWNKGLNVLVESFDDGGNRIGRYATTLGDPRDGPTFIDLRREGYFEGLYKLKITTSGGTAADGLYDYGCYLAIDDLRVC